MTAAPRSEGEGHAVRESVPAEMTGAGTDVNSVQNALELCTMRTSDMDGETRQSVVRLCIDAHQEEDFQNLFSYLPPEGLHVLAYLHNRLVGHAVVTIRWLQAGNGPLLRTAYVDAVATSPGAQGQGIGSAVMRHLASVVDDCDIACLETDRAAFYERLGWEDWRGPLGGRSTKAFIPTPDQSGITILRLTRTQELDLHQLLTIEAHSARIW
jgi:aminoglycoside 2'-N-acetyltransferase I